jgi:hypothetical protein
MPAMSTTNDGWALCRSHRFWCHMIAAMDSFMPSMPAGRALREILVNRCRPKTPLGLRIKAGPLRLRERVALPTQSVSTKHPCRDQGPRRVEVTQQSVVARQHQMGDTAGPRTPAWSSQRRHSLVCRATGPPDAGASSERYRARLPTEGPAARSLSPMAMASPGDPPPFRAGSEDPGHILAGERSESPRRGSVQDRAEWLNGFPQPRRSAPSRCRTALAQKPCCI